MNPATSSEISVDELRTLLERHEPVTVLDIRESAVHAEWAIPGSLHHDRYVALKAGDLDALAGIDLPAGIPVVTLCTKGYASGIAANLLRADGIDARSLSGGMAAWSLAWNLAELSLPGSDASIIQIRRTGKGCLSYLIGSDGEAVVIDASVAPDIYATLAAERGWTITHLLDTHIHADHLSRSRLLAERTGATLHLPATDRVAYSFVPIDDGDAIAFGNSRLEGLATPGHTPEAMSYLLDRQAIFTGDTLFLAGVGRPDLEADADEAGERAALLWNSLQRLVAFPTSTLILPGHTSNPVAFDEQPIVATLHDVIAQVPMLRLSQTAFSTTILSRLPPTPPNHAAIVAFNEAGEQPAGEPADLEAGANRCAIA